MKFRMHRALGPSPQNHWYSSELASDIGYNRGSRSILKAVCSSHCMDNNMYRVKVLIALLLAAVVIDASKEPNDATDVTSQIGNILGKTLQMVEQCGNKRITACLKVSAFIYNKLMLSHFWYPQYISDPSAQEKLHKLSTHYWKKKKKFCSKYIIKNYAKFVRNNIIIFLSHEKLIIIIITGIFF